jgi:hypothetical protein
MVAVATVPHFPVVPMIIPIVLYGHGEHLFSPVLDALPPTLPREPILILELQKQ